MIDLGNEGRDGMKEAHAIILFRIEDWLEQIIGNRIPGIIVSVQGTEVDLEKTGIQYNMITFKIEDRVFTTEENSETFWVLIQQAEQKRSINTLFQRYNNALKKQSPELYENELNLWIAPVNTYLIYIAVVALIFAFLGFY